MEKQLIRNIDLRASFESLGKNDYVNIKRDESTVSAVRKAVQRVTENYFFEVSETKFAEGCRVTRIK